MNILSKSHPAIECRGCAQRTGEYFCDLPDEASAIFRKVKIAHSYPRGTTLFAEGQPANGVYTLCSGRVKLSTYSEDGKAIIVRVVEAGGVLGLSACIAGLNHEATAQVLENCQLHFIRREEFFDLIEQSPAAAIKAMEELSRNYYHAHSQICSLGLSASAGDKLAKLFLEWYDHTASGPDASGRHIPINYTHEEMAEMIGASRETVTRLLKSFSTRGLISLRRNDLYIPDRQKLASAVGCRHSTM